MSKLRSQPIKILLTSDLNELWPTKRDLIHELANEFPNIRFYKGYTESEQRTHIVDADATFGIPSAKIFELNQQLKWVHHPVSGFELETNHPIVNSKVILTNAPNAHVIAMAEYVFATMLAMTHRMGDHLKDQRQKKWEPTKYISSIRELNGQNLGIIGFGEVGKAIAKRAYGFGMNTFGIARTNQSFDKNIATVWTPEKIDNLLSISDWIVIAAPLTSQTRNLIDEIKIKLIRPNAHVIILSRAHIIHETSLITALTQGKLGGAIFDNFENQRPSDSSPLWDMDNVIITPHTSSMSSNLENDRFNIYKHNIHKFIEGGQFMRVADKLVGY
mgnify:CR=1 FL=1